MFTNLLEEQNVYKCLGSDLVVGNIYPRSVSMIVRPCMVLFYLKGDIHNQGMGLC